MVPANRATKAGDAYIGFQTPNRDLPTLVVFRDSCANSLIPFLSESFSKSIYIKWRLNNVIDFSDIAREKPKIVILEIVERWIGIFLEI